MGFLEKVFENALRIALRDNGHKVLQQAPLSVYFRGQVVGEYFADLMVDDSFVIEVKAVKTLLPEHQAQLINYLNATRVDHGLLVNFGLRASNSKDRTENPDRVCPRSGFCRAAAERSLLNDLNIASLDPSKARA